MSVITFLATVTYFREQHKIHFLTPFINELTPLSDAVNVTSICTIGNYSEASAVSCRESVKWKMEMSHEALGVRRFICDVVT